jgi:hypothetical protein
MTTEKISEDKFVKVTLQEDNLEISFKYSRYSTLENRFKFIDKFKEVLRKI